MAKFAALLPFLLIFGCAFADDKPALPPLAWNFQVKQTDGHPKGQVFLKVDGRDYLVVQEATTNYQQLKPADYADYRIPAQAVLAAYSWYAGYGDILYVVPKGRRLEVYRQEMDEAEDSRFPVKRIETIPF